MVAVFGTQTLATLIAVYGLVHDAPWLGLGVFVWGYALAWFLVSDRVKLLAYRILDPAKPRCGQEAASIALPTDRRRAPMNSTSSEAATTATQIGLAAGGAGRSAEINAQESRLRNAWRQRQKDGR